MAAMVAGFLCVPIFKFVVQGIDGIGVYFVQLDVLAPSFLISMVVAWFVSKIYPPKLTETSVSQSDAAQKEES